MCQEDEASQNVSCEAVKANDEIGGVSRQLNGFFLTDEVITQYPAHKKKEHVWANKHAPINEGQTKQWV